MAATWPVTTDKRRKETAELATVMVELHQEEWSLGHGKCLCYYKEPFAGRLKVVFAFIALQNAIMAAVITPSSENR